MAWRGHSGAAAPLAAMGVGVFATGVFTTGVLATGVLAAAATTGAGAARGGWGQQDKRAVILRALVRALGVLERWRWGRGAHHWKLHLQAGVRVGARGGEGEGGVHECYLHCSICVHGHGSISSIVR